MAELLGNSAHSLCSVDWRCCQHCNGCTLAIISSKGESKQIGKRIEGFVCMCLCVYVLCVVCVCVVCICCVYVLCVVCV